MTASDIVKQEMTVLLDRVFHAQDLTFFGEDGNGLYGQATYPVTASVRCFDIDVVGCSDDTAEIEAYVRIFLNGYIASTHGHAITDQNLRISLDRLLDREQIDRDALTWARLDYQGETFICLAINANKLLAW